MLPHMRKADGGAGIAFDLPLLIAGSDLVAASNAKLAVRWPEIGEDRSNLLGHLADHVRHALAEGDPAPLGKGLNGIRTLVIARHILAALAAERANEFALIGEVLATIMQGHAFAVPRQGNIGTMAVRSAEHTSELQSLMRISY